MYSPCVCQELYEAITYLLTLVTSLILLDSSAAFDTVDHSTRLHRHQNWFVLHDTSLDWFSSYLTSRSRVVSIRNSLISLKSFSCCTSRGRTWLTSFHNSLFSLSGLALSSPRTQSNIIFTLTTPSYTFLSFLHSTFVTVCQKRYHQSFAEDDGIIDGDASFFSAEAACRVLQ